MKSVPLNFRWIARNGFIDFSNQCLQITILPLDLILN